MQRQYLQHLTPTELVILVKPDIVEQN